MQILKCQWWQRHWFWLPVLVVTGSLSVTAPTDSTADLLGGPLPLDGSDDLIDDVIAAPDDSAEVDPLAVNASAGPIDGVAVHEKSQRPSSNMSSNAPASQFLRVRNQSSISLTTTTTQTPTVSDGGGDDMDRRDIEDSGNSSTQHTNASVTRPSDTVVEQLLHVQLAALRQENEALHAALSHSSASAAALDKELEKAENNRAQAESVLHASEDEKKKMHDVLNAMGAKIHSLEAQHVEEVKQMQSEKHSLEVNLSATQNQTIEIQKQLQAAMETGKVALSSAEKQEADLTAGLQKARAGEDQYHNKAAELAKNLDKLWHANLRLRAVLQKRVQQFHKSEKLRLRVEGALDHAEKEVTKLAKRTGSEQWFEEQVAELRAGLQNATHEAKFSREARDAEQALLEAAQRDRKTLTNKLVALNQSDAQRIRWLTAALAESKAQTLREEGNLSKALQVAAQLRSTLKDTEQRRKAAEGAVQESANRSTIVKQFAEAEVQRARKETDDAELAAGKAVTKAAIAEGQVTELRRNLQAAQVEHDDLKSSQKQELQSAQDLAAEVQRLRADLADTKNRLASSEQHAAALQAQFNAVSDLQVPKAPTSSSHSSADGKKYAKQQHSTRDKMRVSLSLIERSTTDSASSQAQENENQDESHERTAVMKGDADRLQALLS